MKEPGLPYKTKKYWRNAYLYSSGDKRKGAQQRQGTNREKSLYVKGKKERGVPCEYRKGGKGGGCLR